MTFPHMLRAPGELSERDGRVLWKMLVAADKEFIPSLSSRNNTTTKQLAEEAGNRDGPQAYFESLQKQWILFGFADTGIVGMMSFVPHYDDELLRAWAPCTYLSTVIVDRAYRRLGMARELYGTLIRHSRRIGDAALATRTWSSNSSHLGLLNELGFVEAARLPNHRGLGLDTIYRVLPAFNDR